MTREPPATNEGWYALHDFRTIDWDAWRDAPERDREAALDSGVSFLRDRVDVTDAEDGSSAVFSMLGHKADLLVLHFRPTMADLDTAERAFEDTEFAEYTDQTNSYVSVTEVGGYTNEEMTKEPSEIEDTGLARYAESKLYPEIPDSEFVCFYPMDKRRAPGENWYDLPFDERADMMDTHGEIGKTYAGKVSQVITGSIGFDDYEWGVDLFSNDATNIKDLLYELRFDESSSKYAEFGPFYFGRQFPPEDLPAFMAGEAVPAEEGEGDSGHPHGESGGHGEGGHHGESESHHGHGDGEGHHHGEGGHHGGSDHHGGDESSSADDDSGSIRGELEDLDIYAGQPHGEDVYAMVLYSEADPEELFEEVDGLRKNFDHYDTHVKTAVYQANEASDRDRSAVVSIWETQSAADTAGGFLADLPGIVARAGEESGFGTMGMFYTVKPEHREDFVEKFETVGGLLGDMDGHLETDLLANREDENDMFIASQWESKEDAMSFFRSDDFADTVDWGRDVLADRPRHVFLA
ncbi:heme-binding protein [Halorussus gelatinilyticus]|uniref:Heme-binding protein n=1 Tax=Halorussus gelatinilyticus TaxID=2937524 RepID=A0A8U0IKZ0_9EURY|nr:heme-binding protein [Halorussus gelatinilyticus]UPW01346.1 heme-binding protein [Halorussus gelatinilyticus]